MNAQINRVRSIAVSCLSVTRYATFQIDFLSRREGRFIDSNWIFLSCLGGRSGPLLFRARLFLAHGGERWAEQCRENSQQLQAMGYSGIHLTLGKEFSRVIGTEVSFSNFCVARR